MKKLYLVLIYTDHGLDSMFFTSYRLARIAKASYCGIGIIRLEGDLTLRGKLEKVERV